MVDTQEAYQTMLTIYSILQKFGSPAAHDCLEKLNSVRKRSCRAASAAVMLEAVISQVQPPNETVEHDVHDTLQPSSRISQLSC